MSEKAWPGVVKREWVYVCAYCRKAYVIEKRAGPYEPGPCPNCVESDYVAELEAENRDLRLYLDTIYEKHGELFFAIKQYGHWREKQEARDEA